MKWKFSEWPFILQAVFAVVQFIGVVILILFWGNKITDKWIGLFHG